MFHVLCNCGYRADIKIKRTIVEYMRVVLKQHEVHHAHGHVFLKRMQKLYPMKTIYFVSIILILDYFFSKLIIVHLTDTFYADSKKNMDSLLGVAEILSL